MATAAPGRAAGFVHAYLITMRPYLLFVSGAAGLVGLSFVPNPDPVRVSLAFAALFLSYGFGQALTDCFQTDTDAISAPYRPLVRGDLTKRQVFVTSLVGLAGAVVVLAALNPVIVLLGAAAVVGLLTYTFFKRRWWGGPAWNSWIVALLPLMGRWVDRSVDPAALIRPVGPLGPAFTIAVGAVFFGYANFVVMGYFKDISADRQTGYNTLPVALGWQPAASVGDATALVAAALAARSIAWIGANVWSVAMLAAGIGAHVFAQAAMHRTNDERATGTPIANSVRAFVLYCLAVTVANRPGWLPLLILFYAAFELSLRLRPERGQV